MRWWQLVLSFLQALRWPGLIFLSIWLFRRQIRELINRIEQGEVAGLVKLTARAREVASEASELPEEKTPEGADQQPLALSPFLGAADILASWELVVDRARKMAEEFPELNILPAHAAPRTIMQRLDEMKLLPGLSIEIVEELRTIRNDVAHAQSPITSEIASSYLFTAERVRRAMDFAARELKDMRING